MIWLLHGWSKIFTSGSLFWNSALLTSLFSASTLGFIYLSLKKNPAVAILITSTLATSKIFWKFAELPDVFSLHWLFLSAVIYFFTTESIKSESKRLWILSLIFGLSFANHHTTLFLAPIWIFQIKTVRNPKQILLSLLAGATITALLYLSIFLQNRCTLYSWGCIESFRDLWNHFSRADYGTFKLAAGTPTFEYWNTMQVFANGLLRDAPVILGFFLITLFSSIILSRKNPGSKRSPIGPRNSALIVCLLSYITVFFSLSNVKSAEFGLEILDRFTVMPYIFCLFLAGRYLEFNVENIKRSYKTFRVFVSRTLGRLCILGFLCFSLLIGIFKNGPFNDFSDHTILDDYLRNFLAQPGIDPKKPTLITGSQDSTYFGLFYMLGILNLRPNFYVVNVFNLHKSWSIQTYQRNIPGIKLRGGFDDGQDSNYSLADFVADNAENFNILADIDTTSPEFKVIMSGVGRYVTQGKGREFIAEDKILIPRNRLWSDIPVADYREYSHELAIYSRYAYYYLAKGLNYYDQQKMKEAVQSFENALEIVPYCRPCLANKCFVLSAVIGKEHKECFNLLADFSSKYFNYYTGEPFTGVSFPTQGYKKLPEDNK